MSEQGTHVVSGIKARAVVGLVKKTHACGCEQCVCLHCDHATECPCEESHGCRCSCKNPRTLYLPMVPSVPWWQPLLRRKVRAAIAKRVAESSADHVMVDSPEGWRPYR